MLIRIVKVSLWCLFKLTLWFAFPLWKLLYRMTWKGTPQQFVIALTEDPEIVNIATNAGLLGVLKIYQQRGMAMAGAPMPPTQEDREWAEFIQNYGENPQPDMVPAYLEYIQRGGTTGSTILPTFGATDALCWKHRDLRAGWVAQFADLFARLEEESERMDKDRPGWNDYHMVRWFIERDDNRAAIIAERTKLPGMVGSTCTWMANSVAQQIPAFREALERVGYEFPQLDMRQAIEHDDMNASLGEPRPADSRLDEQLSRLVGQSITAARANERDNRTYITFETPAQGVQFSAPILAVSFREEDSC